MCVNGEWMHSGNISMTFRVTTQVSLLLSEGNVGIWQDKWNISVSGDQIVFTNVSVMRGLYIRINGKIIVEGSGAIKLTTSSMQMEVKRPWDTCTTIIREWLSLWETLRKLNMSMQTGWRFSEKWLFAE